jgi:hypothetical protein
MPRSTLTIWTLAIVTVLMAALELAHSPAGGPVFAAAVQSLNALWLHLRVAILSLPQRSTELAHAVHSMVLLVLDNATAIVEASLFALNIAETAISKLFSPETAQAIMVLVYIMGPIFTVWLLYMAGSFLRFVYWLCFSTLSTIYATLRLSVHHIGQWLNFLIGSGRHGQTGGNDRPHHREASASRRREASASRRSEASSSRRHEATPSRLRALPSSSHDSALKNQKQVVIKAFDAVQATQTGLPGAKA